MTRTFLLQAACTAALLAAGPALAQQTMTPPGATGPNGAPNPVESQHKATTNSASMGSPGMAPAGSGAAAMKSGQTASTGDESHSTHRSGATHPTQAMHGKTDTSQNAAVDRLNDQSFQSAQQGQAFSATGSDSGSGMSTAPTTPGGMSSGSAPGGK